MPSRDTALSKDKGITFLRLIPLTRQLTPPIILQRLIPQLTPPTTLSLPPLPLVMPHMHSMVLVTAVYTTDTGTALLTTPADTSTTLPAQALFMLPLEAAL